MKTWVIPRSEPSHTNFADAELRILNDRGFGFGAMYQPGRAGRNQNASNTKVAVANRAISRPSPNKPFVKLPPQDGKLDQSPDVEDSEPEESPPVTISQTDPAPQTRQDLPGKRWTEKWKEANGFQENITELTNGNEQKKPELLLPIENENESSVVSAQKTPRLKGSSARGQMQYKINIPPPSFKQMHMFRPNSGSVQNRPRNTYTGGPPIKHVYQVHPSTFSQTAISHPHRTYGKTFIQSTPKITTSIPRVPATENATKMKKPMDTDRNNPTKPMVETAWESLASENHTSSQSREDISVLQISNPPIFPFPQATDSETFPFHPVLIEKPAIQIIESIKSNSSDDIPTTNSHKAKITSQLLIDDSPTTQISLVKSTVCYEWNYFLTCSTTENGECQKVHVCEICGSSEHRATQHWHHLATAPLPEIQMQPKLSTFAPPPESPTLSALKEHTSRFMNRSIDLSSQQSVTPSSRLSRISMVVPPLGLQGSHRVAAQAERLKFRKRLVKLKLIPSIEDTITTTDTPNLSTNISPTLPTLDPITTQNFSPFEKPVEVILPPPLRPFQRKSTPTDNITAHDDPVIGCASPGGLRVTAPAFEPSYAGAWIPFAGASNQFNGLFKIPN